MADVAGSALAVDLEGVAARAVAAAHDRGFKVVLDPSPADRVTADHLRGADVVTPNPGEAETITGIAVTSFDSAVEAGRAILSESFVGAVFTSVSTSTPELVTAVSAIRRGALTLAVADILGGNAFDVLFDAASDVA